MLPSVVDVGPWMRARHKVAYLCPLLVQDGGSFKHFVVDVLPKLMQAREVLLAARVSILLYPSGSRMVRQMLSRLGFSANQLMSYYGGGIYKSSHQVNTCVTPPYHPALWGAARRLFGVRASLQDPTTSLIILMARSGCV